MALRKIMGRAGAAAACLATALACAAPGAFAAGGGTPILKAADVPRPDKPVNGQPPFRPADPAAYANAKRQAQSRASLARPLGPLGFAPAPQAVVSGTLNQPGLAAGDNAARNSGTPPDPTGAVGPSHYVEFVNSVVRVYSKSDLSGTGAAVQLDDFVGATNNFVFDPQIQYDPVADRWFYLADDCTDSVCGSNNFLAFGWSKTSDPGDLVNGWCKYAIRTDSGTDGFFDDYPKLGHDNSHLIFGTNVFGGNGAFVSSRIWTIPKPPAGPITTCGAAGTAHFFSGPAAAPVKDASNLNASGNKLRLPDGSQAFTPVPANTQDASANGYVVAGDGVSPLNQVMVWHVSGAAGSEALTADSSVAVTSFSTPANVPQPGSSDVLDSSDTRLTQAVAHNDPDAGGEAIWTQHTIASSGRSAVRWYEIVPGNTTPRQQGNVTNATSFVFNGAISPTMAGNEAVVQYNVGGTTQLAQIRASSRVGGDTLGAMSGEVTLGTSSAADQDFSCPSADPTAPSCRWGDYAGATPDPANSHVVWGTNQLIGTASADNPRWTTRNFALLPSDTPVASFSAAPSPAFTGKTVSFDASTSKPPSGGTIDKYEWDLDGNGTFETDTGTVDHTTKTYNTVQAVDVALRVTSGVKTDTITHALSVVSNAPTASFTATPSTVTRAAQVQFDGSASTDAEVAGGIQTYKWDFDGDGIDDDTTTGATPTHTYGTAGSYQVRLIVIDSDDGVPSAQAFRTVTVVNPTPAASFTVAPNPVFTNKAVTLDASGSSVAGGAIDRYEWDLDGNGTFETDGGSDAHKTTSYGQPRTLNIGLRVTAGGVSNTTTRSLTVMPGAPTASFNVSPGTSTRGTSVSFDGSASADAESPGGIASYAWDFDGNGTTDATTTTPTTTHSYSSLGAFNARLIVTDADEGTASAATFRLVTVQDAAPVAQLAFSPAQPQTGQTVSFSASGSSDPDGSVAVYRWDLDGDGVFETNTGSQPAASRSYSTPGNYAVKVQVQDNDGATATAGATLPVTAAPNGGGGLKLTFSVGRTAKLASLLRNGLRPRLACGVSCRVKLTLKIPRSLARSMRIRTVIGSATVSVSGTGAKRVRIRLTRTARRQLAHAKRFRLTLTGSAFDGAAHSSAAKKSIAISR